ncbi:MAG TPA: fibronectin-binding domain-containing protein [Firmicutes bacterium]|nr:fibronectin-binding domain-containing protein [Bacillota bacterium]
MPMDAAVFAALAAELPEALRESRVERIVALNPREVCLALRGTAEDRSAEVTLTLSLDGPLSRLQWGPVPLAVVPRFEGSRPAPVPPFILLLRRHLSACRLAGVRHPAWERILHLDFVGPADEFPRRRFTLVYELLGTQANLLLLDWQGILMGALRPLPSPERQTRLVQGAPYALPAPAPAVPGAPLPYLRQALALALPETPLGTALVRNLGGLSPFAAASLARAAGLDPSVSCGGLNEEAVLRLHAELEAFAQAVAENRFSPVVWCEDGLVRDFWVHKAPAPPGWLPEPAPTANAAVTRFFSAVVETTRLQQARHTLLQRLDAQLARAERRLKAQRQDLTRAEQADDLRRAGEAILANLPQLSRGMSSFTGAGYGDPTPLRVELDPRLGPSENAQRYFERYRKAKRGQEEAAARVAVTAALARRLREARFEVQEAEGLDELQTLAAELSAEGILEEREEKGEKQEKERRIRQPKGTAGRGQEARTRGPAGRLPAAKPTPRRYRSSEGYEILAGRNSRENDWLTLRTGAPHDLWLHAKDLAGAHVILRLPAEGYPPERALWEAAQVAAFHSEGRESSQVPVDYTFRRHVRKAPGGRPGQVLYDHHHTLYVTPDPALVARLRVNGTPAE